LGLAPGSRGLGGFFLDDLLLGEPVDFSSTEVESSGGIGVVGAGTGVG